MSDKRGLFVVLGLIIVVLTVLAGLQLTGVAQARPPAQEPTQGGIVIPYPGRLTDNAGLAVEGVYNFTFAIYDAEAGGTLLWSEEQEGVAVRAGSFVVSLGSVEAIPADLLAGGDRWLEVSVRGPEEAAFTTLSPRQQLRAAAAPAASINQAAPCPHDHMGETWSLTSPDISVMFQGIFVAFQAEGDIWAGIWGDSNSNVGVVGTSTSAQGVVGQSATGYGGEFECTDDERNDLRLGGDEGWVNARDNTTSELHLRGNGDVSVHVDYDANGDHYFEVINSNDFAVCWVEENGDLTCSGTKSAVVETSTGWHKLYAVESPEVWHEDVGTATLVDGEATVAFEPIFAQTINLEENYHVFLTPLGQEIVLLLVTAKTPAGFTVRGVTLDGQPAACSFDYRVMAKRLGYENVRLEQPARPMGEAE